mmetsp:Transcript_2974/g.6709  ORF Transcript_2974/g.6709 Transcript_2974/m.6709 type:complete len:215 (+) Transcript_2974:1225-1869(+)
MRLGAEGVDVGRCARGARAPVPRLGYEPERLRVERPLVGSVQRETVHVARLGAQQVVELRLDRELVALVLDHAANERIVHDGAHSRGATRRLGSRRRLSLGVDEPELRGVVRVRLVADRQRERLLAIPHQYVVPFAAALLAVCGAAQDVAAPKPVGLAVVVAASDGGDGDVAAVAVGSIDSCDELLRLRQRIRLRPVQVRLAPMRRRGGARRRR